MNDGSAEFRASPPLLTVTAAEAGQKLLHFLRRRVDVPDAAIHRWIRTGQVRINGGRGRAFDRVDAGDKVRVPPFALNEARVLPERAQEHASGAVPRPMSPSVAVFFENDALLICNKPAGLPVHAGTGHADSLIARLHALYAGNAFLPTPAHRLDKATSGLIIVAKTYAALRLVQDGLAGGAIVKTYLAWVRGDWPWTESTDMEDRLIKTRGADGRERVRVAAEEEDGAAARLTARCLERRRNTSLLELILHTGRTHQIRAQLASRGFPLIGDPKYGGPPCDQGLLLHASGLTFAPELTRGLGLTLSAVVCPSPWRDTWKPEPASGKINHPE